MAEDGARTMRTKLQGLVVAGVALTLAGLVLQWLHLCPIVKRIWTSSYTLYSGGPDPAHARRLLRGDRDPRAGSAGRSGCSVIGANSIAIYVMSWTLEHFVSESLKRHLGSAPFLRLRPAVRAGPSGRRRPARVLGDPLLDVPAEDLHPDLSGEHDFNDNNRRTREREKNKTRRNEKTRPRNKTQRAPVLPCSC